MTDRPEQPDSPEGGESLLPEYGSARVGTRSFDLGLGEERAFQAVQAHTNKQLADAVGAAGMVERLKNQTADAVAASGLLQTYRQILKDQDDRIIRVAQYASQALLGNSMATSNLAALWANNRVIDMMGGIAVSGHLVDADIIGSQIGAITRLASHIEHYNAVLAGLRPSVDVARPVVFATRAWQDVIRVTPEGADGRYLERFEVAGRGTGWAVQAGIALTEDDESKVRQLQAEASASLGPAVASVDLRLRLREIHPNLSQRLDGAWERINGGGADAASQAANSLIELIDQTLRILAPDGDVLAWYAAGNRAMRDLNAGRPTRTIRMEFVVRNHPEKKSSLDLYVKATRELVDAIQSSKHALGLTDEKVLAPLALTVEALLHFLLVD